LNTDKLIEHLKEAIFKPDDSQKNKYSAFLDKHKDTLQGLVQAVEDSGHLEACLKKEFNDALDPEDYDFESESEQLAVDAACGWLEKHNVILADISDTLLWRVRGCFKLNVMLNIDQQEIERLTQDIKKQPERFIDRG